MTQGVECLSSKCEILDSNLYTTERKSPMDQMGLDVQRMTEG
jgi:hypothetical protein